MVNRIRRSLGVALIIGACSGTMAQAADSEGNYAVLGAGSFSCQRYIDTAEAQETQEINQFISWMQGYLSAMNREAEGTFAVTPFVAATDTAAMLLNVCRKTPDTRVETALSQLVQFLAEYRIESSSEIAQIASGDMTVAIRESVLIDVKQRLAEQGYVVGDGGSLYDDELQQAIRSFQQEEGLAVTGVPDADTLLRLFYQ